MFPNFGRFTPASVSVRLAIPLIALGAFSSAAGATALPVLLDGNYDDWTEPALHTDPAGDEGPTGIDFRNLWVAEDDDWLFIRFDTTIEIPVDEGSNLALYIDTDSNSGTGVSVGGLGAELRWRLGFRSGTYYVVPPINLGWTDIDFRVAPSTTSTQFEIAIGRHVSPDGNTPLFSGDDIRLLIRDESGTAADNDWIPDSGEFVTYTFTNEGLPPEPPNDLVKLDPGHLRFLTWNVRFDGMWDPALAPKFERMLQAIDPDVINFQEVFTHSASQTRALVESWLPSSSGEMWFAFDTNDAVTVTRFPFIGLFSSGDNFIGLLETSDVLGRDLLVINAHLACCDNDEMRQQEADAIMSFLRDATSPGGSVDLDPDTGIVITGDLNLVGDAQQLRTLVSGDIDDETTYGPDFMPDWDGTDLFDMPCPQSETRMAYTIRNDASSFYPARIDMIIHTDSVLGVGNRFTLYTPNMSAPELSTHGLLVDDSLASDHLPVVADFFDRAAVTVSDVSEPSILRAHPNPTSAGFRLDVPDVEGEWVAHIVNVKGERVRSLDSRGARNGSLVWDGFDFRGAPVPPGRYFVSIRGGGGRLHFRSTVTVIP